MYFNLQAFFRLPFSGIGKDTKLDLLDKMLKMSLLQLDRSQLELHTQVKFSTLCEKKPEKVLDFLT